MWRRSCWKGARLLHVAGSFLMPKLDGEPTARVLAGARRRGLITCLDTCWDAQGRWMSLLASCLPHLDHFVPSIEEARQLTGRSDPDGGRRGAARCGRGHGGAEDG